MIPVLSVQRFINQYKLMKYLKLIYIRFKYVPKSTANGGNICDLNEY